MGLHTLIRNLVTPYAVIFFTVILSFIAWLTPNFGILRKGFSEPFSIFSLGFFIAFIWYFLAIILAFISYNLAVTVKLSPSVIDRYASLDKKIPYYIFTCCAFIGCVASFMVIFSSIGFDTSVSYLLTGQANQLKYILYEDYSSGLLTLRYLAIHSCALAIFRRYKLKIRSRFDFINILLLISIVIISSRLSLIMAIFLSLLLFITHSDKIKIKPLKIFFSCLVLFVILSALSYSRNKGFYENQKQHFWTAGISEIVTYLGTPFQGAIAVGNNSRLILMNPTDWNNYAYIEESLSTNSAFLQLFQTYGWFSFIIMVCSVSFFSFLAGFLKSQKNNFLFLSVLTIFYAFAEFWRLYWFGTGIMLILSIFPVFTVILTVLLSKSAWRSMIS